MLEFVRLAFPFFSVDRRLLLDGNIGPCPCVLGVDAKPLFKTRFGVGPYRFDWTFRLAHAAIDTLIGVDNEHVLALVKAVHGADLHTIHQLTFDAALVDDIGQWSVLSRIAMASSHIARLARDDLTLVLISNALVPPADPTLRQRSVISHEPSVACPRRVHE